MKEVAIVRGLGSGRRHVRIVPLSLPIPYPSLYLLVPGLGRPAHPIREGLLSPPQNRLGEQLVVCEGRPQHPFFATNPLARTQPFRGNAANGRDKLLVEEGRARLEPVAANTAVRAKHVVAVNLPQQPCDLLFVRFIVRGPKEIQVGAEYLVRPVPVENDLGLRPPPNLPRDKPVADRGAHSRDIIGLDVPNDLGNHGKELVGCNNNLRVVGAYPGGNFARMEEVGRALEADRVGLEGCSAGHLELPLDERGD